MYSAGVQDRDAQAPVGGAADLGVGPVEVWEVSGWLSGMAIKVVIKQGVGGLG